MNKELKEKIKNDTDLQTQLKLVKKISKKVKAKRVLGIAVSLLSVLSKGLYDWKNQTEPPVKYPPIIDNTTGTDEQTSKLNTAYSHLITKLNKDSEKFDFSIDTSYKLKSSIIDDLGDIKQLNLVFVNRNKSVTYTYDISKASEYKLTSNIPTAIEQIAELQIALQTSGLMTEPRLETISNELNEIFDNNYNLYSVGEVSNTTKLDEIGRNYKYFMIYGKKIEDDKSFNTSILVSMSEYNIELNDITDIKEYFYENPDSDLFKIEVVLTPESKMEKALSTTTTLKTSKGKTNSFDENYFTF